VIINTLTIDNLRNITHTELNFSPNTNIITGDNGAGKTTLLEAIYLLGRAKSFRPGHPSSIIQRGKKSLMLFSQLIDTASHQHKIGLERSGSNLRIKIDGVTAKKLSTLAKTLPIVLITPQSHRLIEEGPEHRRRILNWGVFHVEHHYKKTMSKFQKSLLQRNNALRDGAVALDVWNSSFANYATEVAQQQSAYFDSWSHQLKKIIEGIPYFSNLTVTYNRGWPKGEELSEALESRNNIDKEKGYTTLGPHRADIALQLDGKAIKQTLSRGQQKVLITCIFLAQARVFREKIGESPIFLFDDLDSELDTTSINSVLGLIDKIHSQVFITTLNPNRFKHQGWTGSSSLFHVEHGEFT
jgi:DNA replication and repair protein RecF